MRKNTIDIWYRCTITFADSIYVMDRNKRGGKLNRNWNKDKSSVRGSKSYKSFDRERSESRSDEGSDNSEFKSKRSFSGSNRNSGRRDSFGKKPFSRNNSTRRNSDENSEERFGGENRSYNKSSRGRFGNSNRRPNRFSNKPRFDKNTKHEPTDLKNKDDIRLNKFIASSGICSRREADNLISQGLISINGEVVTQLGTKVKAGDEVRYGGEKLRFEKYLYILMNKPKDIITTADDPQGRMTVLDIIGRNVQERVYPVGRLDRQTTGLLLLTNDGDLAKRLTHPKHGVNKIYHVTLNKAVTKTDMQRMTEGVELEDGMAVADAVSYVSGDTNKKEIAIRLHSGRNRVIRRMMETLGYEVVKLDRVAFAGLTKKKLLRGKWRHLNEKEVGMLKMNS